MNKGRVKELINKVVDEYDYSSRDSYDVDEMGEWTGYDIEMVMAQWNSYFAREWEDDARNITVDDVDYDRTDDDDAVRTRIEELIDKMGENSTNDYFSQFCDLSADGVDYDSCKNAFRVIENILDYDDTIECYNHTKKLMDGNTVRVYEVGRTDGTEFTVSLSADQEGDVTWDGRTMSQYELHKKSEELEEQYEADHER
ncbi:MAG: hypothetical protein ACYC69_02620 [Thermodesulfovibrionales bacterium]